MHPTGNLNKTLGKLLGALAVAAILSPTAHAAVVHKYTFNANTAEDSVGTADGTLIDATGIATYTGGALNLTANNGATSGDLNTAGAVGAYVDLPNNILTDAVLNGSFGQTTLEMWLTVQEHRTWAEAFVFGTSTGGEGISDNGDGQSYIALIPRSGPNDFRGTTRSPTAEAPIIGGAPLALNQRHHVVMVLDGLDSTAGLNGTVSLYLNNGAPVTAAIEPFIDSMVNNNNWFGRSLFGGDALFDGLIDEFRIHDNALDAAAVAASFTAGPEAAPLPVLVVDRTTGAITIANQTPGNIQLKGYSITSAAGGLNPATWASIDAGNVFDPNGTWTAQSSTTLQITESVTGGTTDGGSLLANTSRGIGTPWQETPFEDLVFSFTLGDNSTGSGLVQYTGAAATRSDFNGDGVVGPADWALFVPNSFTAFAADTAVAAYKKGDLDGDKDNDYLDFKLFKADYVAANGLAAFNSLAGAVPEPTALSLTAIGLAMLGVTRRNRHSK